MTFKGVLVVDLILLVLIIVVVSLAAKRRLHAAYAVIWICVFIGAGTLVTVTPILNKLSFFLGARFPASALTLVALLFLTLVLVYVSSQLTILGDRVTKLVQYIGISELDMRENSIQSHDTEETVE